MARAPDPMKELLRSSFYAFTIRAFQEVYPGTEFKQNWHLELIASRLEAVARGEVKRLIINIPPRSLKSFLTSVAFVAWWLGHHPHWKAMCVSYGQDLADALSADCRRVMSSNWYRETFPEAALVGSKQTVSEFTTSRGGGRLATSIGGAVTGRGAHLLIFDDPLKPDEAMSESMRKTVNDAYGRTFISRLNDKTTNPIILVMQRLHVNDLTAYVQDLDQWELLSLPAIAPEDQEFEFQTSTGSRRHVWREGEALHPEREPLQVLLSLRKAQGEYDFSAQYLQAPMPLGGRMINVERFGKYDLKDLPETPDRVVQSWDTASKPGELNDYSVCTTWIQKGDLFYLRHVFRERIDFPALRENAVRLQRDFRANHVLVEDKGSGIQLFQQLRADGMYEIEAVKPEGDKIIRMHTQTPPIENGFVLLPREAPWLGAYLAELASFPDVRFDDQVDSTSQALKWMVERAREPALLTYYREEAAKERGEAPKKMVRLKHPLGGGSLILKNGWPARQLPDGTFEVPEDEAPNLMHIGWTKVE